MRRGPLIIVALFALAAALRMHNAWVAPPLSGFDGPFHAAYMGVVYHDHRLPLPHEGWSTFHPPLYYATTAALWTALPDLLGPRWILYALRLVNVLAGLGLGLAVFGIGRRAVPDRPQVAVYAAAIALFLPMHIGPASFLGNELPAAALAALGIWLLFGCLEKPENSGRALLCGAVLGAAVLTKVNALCVLAAAGIGLLFVGARSHGWRFSSLKPAALLGAAALLVSGGYFARNVYHYGEPIAMQVGPVPALMAQQGYGPARPLDAYLSLAPDVLFDPADKAARRRSQVWPVTFASVWFDIHGTTLQVRDPDARIFSRILFACGGVITAMTLLGLFAILGRRVRVAVPYGGTTLVLVGALALAAYAGFTYRIATLSALKGTYLSPGVPAFAVLAGLGFDLLGRQRAALSALAAAFLTVFVLASTAISWIGWLAPMQVNPADFYIRAYSDEASRRVYEYFVLGRER
ncbi:MAG: glycosyltransferase family 39 protein [Myxococcales bacterium]|nr:glycosyltransferase family 39 protein [Myxococcales bacterium]